LLIGFAALCWAFAANVLGEPPVGPALWWSLFAVFVALAIHELLGKPVPFLRWSFIRMLLGMKTLLEHWQVGDGREQAVLRFVLANAPAGDLDACIAAIDRFAYRHSFLINVGDEKGAILDSIVRRVAPRRVLELGAYVGYSALRIVRVLPPGSHLYSIEFNADNAKISEQIARHAGVSDRVTFITGYLGDDGKTLASMASQHGFTAGSLDLVFIDHAKEEYVPDLKRLLEAGFLHPGSVAVADNVVFPGAPEYQAYMNAEEGKLWRSTPHKAHVEYQSLIPDVVLESTLIG
jgi:catechol O-methyltransferase